MRKLPVALTTLSVLLLGAGWWVARSAARRAPVCALLLGPERTPARPFAETAAGTPARVEVRWHEPLHVWVASWSATDGTLALFPSPWLRTAATNPLPAGTATLPGRDGERDLDWPTRPVPGVTHYLVVASSAPLPELDQTFTRLRQASNTTFPDGSLVITAPKDRTLSDVPPRERMAHPLLEQAGAETGAGGHTTMREVADRPGVWLASFQVVPPPNK